MGDDDGEQLQRSVFFWIGLGPDSTFQSEGPTDEAEQFTISGEEVARKHGVPKVIIEQHLGEELEEAESCQSLPFTLLLVFSYACMVITHENAANIIAVEGSVDFDIWENANFAFTDHMGHKGLWDVNSHADFWSWMIKGFLPLVFQQGHGFSEERDTSLPEIVQAAKAPPAYFQDKKARGMMLHYNRIVMGIRMQQEVSNLDGAVNCSTTKQLLNFYNKNCVAGLGYELDPEMWFARQSTDPTRKEWLYAHDDLEVTQEKLLKLELNHWLDQHTRKVEIAVPLYNAEYGIHSFILVVFFFSRGGHIWKDIIKLSAYANWHPNLKAYMYDLMWLCCLLWIIVVEVIEILGVIKEKGTKALATDYIGFWNAVDWGSVYAGMVVLTMFYVNLAQTNNLNMLLQELGGMHPIDEVNLYRAKGEEVMEALEKQVNYANKFKLVLALYPLGIVFRLFKAFASQPRLAVVTQTIVVATVDLLHFLLVFVSIFYTYTVAGVMLFGREVDAFTTFGRGINTCFRIMLGDFDWEEIAIVGRVDAGIWFWTYMIVVVLLMLNMLLAIVMDAYSDVNGKIGSAETLVEEGVQLWKRWRGAKKGELVPLDIILKCVKSRQGRKEMRKIKCNDAVQQLAENYEVELESVGNDDVLYIVTVDGLKRAVDNLRTNQAVDLIMAALMNYYSARAESAGVDELLQLVRTVDFRTKQLREKQKEVLGLDEPDSDEEDGGGEDDGKKAPGENQHAELDADGDVRFVDDDDEDAESGETEEKVSASQVSGEEEKDKGPNLEEQLKDLLDTCKNSFDKARDTLYSGNDPTQSVATPWLAQASQMIATQVVKDPTGEDLGNYNQDEADGQNGFTDLSSLTGQTAVLLSDANAAIELCRKAGIGPEHDELRRAAAGSQVQVLQVDFADGTVQCRVPGVGDVWFAAGALAPERRKTEDGEEKSTTISEKSAPGPTIEGLERRAIELEQELEVGRQTVQEAFLAVSELEQRLRKSQQMQQESHSKFGELKSKAQYMSKDNKKAQDVLRQKVGKLEAIGSKRDEYYDLVKKMLKENKDLQSQLAETQSQVRQQQNGNSQVNTSALERQIRQVRQETRQGEQTAADAAKVLANRIDELIRRCITDRPAIADALREHTQR